MKGESNTHEKIAVLEEEKARIQRVEELHKQHPDNPLFRDIIDAPKDFVSVFHHAEEEDIDNIGKSGLNKKGESVKKTISQKRMERNLFFDKYAPKGFSRSDAIFAYQDEFLGLTRFNPEGEVILEIKGDPKKLLVVNQEIFTGTDMDDPDALKEKRAKRFWENAMTLYEYQKLSEDEKLQRDLEELYIEILIPDDVPSKMIKIYDKKPKSKSRF